MKLSLSTPTPPLPALITNCSPEQQAVLDWISSGSGSAIVEACAGSGKSYLIEAAVCLINHTFPDASIAVLAYNRKIADELSYKLRKRGVLRTTCDTAHKFGMTALQSAVPSFRRANSFKLSDLCKKLCAPFKLSYPYQEEICKLVTLAKDSGIGLHIPNTTISFAKLAEHHDCVVDTTVLPYSRFLTLCSNLLSLSISSTEHDITDLIYSPLIHNYPIKQYDFVFIDEAQDINATRLELASRMLASSGRLIAVGDPFQAIYGFTGADDSALSSISSSFSCTRFPLSYSRRCAQAIISEAHKLISFFSQDSSPLTITALPSAPPGSISSTTYDSFLPTLSSLSPTSAILCRTNSPLISLAIQCIKRSIPCRIEGKDIGEELLRLIRKLKPEKLSDLPSLLNSHLSSKSKLPPHKLSQLTDRIDCIHAFIPISHSLSHLRSQISTLFSDYDPSIPPVLTFCSVHKSKGLEWPHVYLLGRNTLMPHPAATSPWQLTQEYNLLYVAITRAQHSLTYISLPE